MSSDKDNNREVLELILNIMELRKTHPDYHYYKEQYKTTIDNIEISFERNVITFRLVGFELHRISNNAIWTSLKFNDCDTYREVCELFKLASDYQRNNLKLALQEILIGII